ncbi:hypothetical protein [Parasphingorhabdus halotolerans]|uniref:Uncharacterized protein n=1 Tax=Parasphingorhabdus halotolerans TaxID=2725558 RepID=A0A6H2DMI6_9SPHN|nr:hypothetical protein [Parasphingorhabdus halotolerans]QJB69564.1 hypothetical protein HF685_09975 [Parasphingorhabdus halotolerans]
MGCIYMVLADAPTIYVLVNGSALVGAIAIALLLKRPTSERSAATLTGLGVLLLGGTLFSSPEIDGVHRWIGLGPIRLHIGVVILPALAAMLPLVDRRIALLSVILVSLIVTLQPDRASAFALFVAVLVLAMVKRNAWVFGMLTFAGAGLIWTLGKPDPLQSVPFVENVIPDAWEFHPFFAAVLALALILALLMPFYRIDFKNHLPLTISLTAMIGFVLISLLGAYPVPLIGYGASAIIGYGLVMGLSTARKYETERNEIETP